jgi:hypothetical protein
MSADFIAFWVVGYTLLLGSYYSAADVVLLPI